jgi:hypothetical protein
MNDDLKTKTVLVVANPLFVALAERLARDFKKVYLWVPFSGSFPTMNAGMVGTGLEGVERVDSIFGPHFNSVDLFVFVDLYHAAEQIYLESIGKRVWGARNGEEMEVYREVAKKLMEQAGLPVNPWRIITGIDALREHLKANKDQHVKIDRWRGLTETFFSPNYETVEAKLDDIQHLLGGFKDVAEFIVEDDLPDRVEIGMDGYCIDGEFPKNLLVGIEVKDLGYVSEFVAWDAVPEPIRRWNERMAPYLATYGYRGFLSTEVRIGKDKVPYMIDLCARAGSPPSELYSEFYENFSEIVWHGAAGVLVEPKAKGKFGVQVVLKSSWASGHWQPVSYPPEFDRNIKLFNCVVVEGKRFVVPLDEEMSEIGAVIGWGDTLEAAIAMVQEAGEAIEGFGIKFGLGPIESAKEEMEKIEALGVSPFSIDKTTA